MTLHATPLVTVPHGRPRGDRAAFGRNAPAADDMEARYRVAVRRSSRLRRLLRMRAPAIIVRNERRMLRAAVDALFEQDETVQVESPSLRARPAPVAENPYPRHKPRR